MRLIGELNIFLAPLGGLILVALEYIRNQSIDRIQRRIMLLISGFAALAILCEFLNAAYSGIPDQEAKIIVYIACFLFFIFQLLAFSGIPLFLDYYINHDAKRVKKLLAILGAVSVANFVVLLANIFGDFYFYITPQNTYMRGHVHIIRVFFSFLPLAVITTDCLLSRKKIGPHQIWLCIFFVVPSTLCGIMDLAVTGSRLLWPCFSLSLLFAHLFMVKADYSRDGLTGLYNRRRCNEFFADLSRGPRRKPYLFLMIDMDDFKRINDTFGHAQGDKALMDVADILKNSVRHRDFVARYGGDEFLLVLEDSPNVQSVQERIMNDLATLNASQTRPYVLAMSIGHGVYEPASSQTPQEFLEHVDFQMFRHKQEQRVSVGGKQEPGQV